MPVFDSFVGAVAESFTQPAQAIYTVLPNNVALLAFQFLGVLAITRSQTPRPVRLALFVTCMWAGLALECNLEPVKSVFDAGHEALAALAPLVQAPAVGGALAALNTLVVWGGMGLGLYGGIVEDEWAFAVKGLACLVARQAFGLATRLPVPPGYVRVEGDWPPETEACPGLIYNPSGHVLGVATLARELRRRGDGTRARAVEAVNALQVVRLIASRGHYSVDVLTALLLAWYVDDRVEAIYARKGKVT
jgi:hypothetical protein